MHVHSVQTSDTRCTCTMGQVLYTKMQWSRHILLQIHGFTIPLVQSTNDTELLVAIMAM